MVKNGLRTRCIDEVDAWFRMGCVHGALMVISESLFYGHLNFLRTFFDEIVQITVLNPLFIWHAYTEIRKHILFYYLQ